MELTDTSKFLSLILRHKPETIGRFEQEFPKQIEEIYFVLFDRDTESAYEKEVDKLY